MFHFVSSDVGIGLRIPGARLSPTQGIDGSFSALLYSPSPLRGADQRETQKYLSSAQQPHQVRPYWVGDSTSQHNSITNSEAAAIGYPRLRLFASRKSSPPPAPNKHLTPPRVASRRSAKHCSSPAIRLPGTCGDMHGGDLNVWPVFGPNPKLCGLG